MTPRLRILATTFILLAIGREAPADDHAPRSNTAPPAAAQKTDKAPRVLVTISKETTYITEPLRKDGYVDYVAALNQRASKGVTPENNAAVLFWKAVGPGPIEPAMRDRYFEMLGMAPLPAEGHYFIPFEKYVENQRAAMVAAGVTPDEKEILKARYLLDSGDWRFWSGNKCPILARWLTANEKPLELIVDASMRRRCYEPLIAGGPLVRASTPAAQELRRIVRALLLRATLRIAEHKAHAAWGDLLAVHRLARLIGQGPTIINALTAFIIDEQACRAERVMLLYGQLSSADWMKMRSDLETLPPIPRMLDIIEPGERFCFLDIVGLVARNGFEEFRNLFGPGKPLSDDQKTVFAGLAAVMDWNVIARQGNSWFDRLAEALRKPTHKERAKALETIAAELRRLKAAYKNKFAHDLFQHPQNATSEWIGSVFIFVLFPPMTIVENPAARAEMRFELTKLGFAMAAYHADHGSCPAKLGQLVPKYAAEIPKDIFTDGELQYKLDGDGYVIYSVGANGEDDGGKEMDDAKHGESWDDIALTVPGPEKAKP